MGASLDVFEGPDLALACIHTTVGPGQFCVYLPGGATLCMSIGGEIADPADMLIALLAQINTALAPLVPFFDILDVIVAIVNCIKAIPASLGPPPSPQPIVDCLQKLAEALAKLLALVPPFPLFRIVKSMIYAIILGLIALRQRLAAIGEHLEAIAKAATLAAQSGNFDLQAVVDCATGNCDVWLQNLNAQMAPLNRLIGLINALMQIAGLPCLPTLADIVDAALEPLDEAISILTEIMNAIPGDIGLTPLPAEPC